MRWSAATSCRSAPRGSATVRQAAIWRSNCMRTIELPSRDLPMQDSALVRKLGVVADLDADDRSRLNELCNDVRQIPRRSDITSEGDRPEHIHLIIKGWAARYKTLPDGSRQIMDFVIPGDFCDLHATVVGHMDHGIVALTPCRVAFINPAAM